MFEPIEVQLIAYTDTNTFCSAALNSVISYLSASECEGDVADTPGKLSLNLSLSPSL